MAKEVTIPVLDAQDAPRAEAVSNGRTAAGIFLVVFAFLFWLQGNRFVPTNDEGILLEPARQVAQGARPYVDFFGYMSPGSYWIQAAFFKLLGVAYWVGRLPVLLGLSLQCALLFWLTAKLSSRRAGWAALIVFAGFQISDPSFLTAQHRWDSGTLALAGLCAAVAAQSNSTFVLSGGLLAAAAWCTPSMVVVILVEAAWILSSKVRRSAFVPFAGGVLAITIASIVWLAEVGSLHAFIEQMLWLKKNYAGVNVMPYGSVIGGYGRLLEGAHGAEIVLRVLLIACLALPAALPPLALALWSWLARRGFTSSALVPRTIWSTVGLLVPASIALIATAFPRADIVHLSFVTAVPHALVAAGFARLLTVRAGAILSFTMIPLSILFSLNNLIASFHTVPLDTPVGRIHVATDLAPQFQKMLRTVRPGDSLYVYPYMPVHYFVTRAANPTRFSFLAPGMMTHHEETVSLQELQSRPPEWMLYMTLQREEFLRVFPNANPEKNRFPDLESWIDSRYEPTSERVNLGGYRLMKRRAGVVFSPIQPPGPST